jgi:hypothetical protein
MAFTPQQLIDQRLRYRLNYLNQIECWNHTGRLITATSVSFPYQNWNATPLPLVRKNGQIITPTSLDSVAGTAVVADLATGDDVVADYNFEYFDDTQLSSFLQNGISRYNMMSPNTSFGFTSFPDELSDWLVVCAYAQCLETILIDLTMWRARLIFADPQMLASSVQATLARLESDISKLVKPRYCGGYVVSSGRWRVNPQVTDYNWQSYTTVQG